MEEHNILHIPRRPTREVAIGKVTTGGGNTIHPQTMTNCSTLDTGRCLDQIAKARAAGCRIVRLTAQGRREAENLGAIVNALAEHGCGDVAIVADIHFVPALAEIAAQYVDKVRINPGNYDMTDPGQLDRLIEVCRTRGVAIRVGVNHGSLSDLIVEQYGDTPQGMVFSAIEFLEIFRDRGFNDVLVSMKSSNVRVMVEAYRLLAGEMARRGMDYPLHLGVTEAGDGQYGRIKSSVGIATLLLEGIGDTLRVSLTEPPENEIPVARAITEYIDKGREHYKQALTLATDRSPVAGSDRTARKREGNLGGGQIPLLYEELDKQAKAAVRNGAAQVLEYDGPCASIHWRDRIARTAADGDSLPVILKKNYGHTTCDQLAIEAAVDFGPLFIDNLADGIWIEAEGVPAGDIREIALSILQAARVRFEKTEFIACPGCGRTLFDLQATLGRVREATGHLKNLKIGVMGCIVNGPGEMADADYGYVGSGPGKVSLYKGKECVLRSISQENAVEALVELIRQHGDWMELPL